MFSPSFLVWAVVASALFAFGALFWLVLSTFRFRRPHPAWTTDDRAWKGVQYAFGRGMLPQEKESAGKHRLTLAAGILYHSGIFAALSHLGYLLLGAPVPAVLSQPSQILFGISACCGLALLIKRALTPQLRAISCPDDYAANVVVDAFLLLSLLAARDRAWLDWLLIVSLIFFVYLPIGKIRHCLFFFYSRILFGLFFGRRRVLPHPGREAQG
ncbi:MAG: hypothetical protein EHM61_08415 [Acidobacteria bacterium]|nr:MAG: hypothetical protein EHM61_08415 [Acidobacteriota bacterium]